MATSLPWYKEVSPTQKKALFAAWLGYVFDGFDYMLITYVLLDIQKEFAMSTTETSTLLLAAFVARPLGGAIFGSFADKYGRSFSNDCFHCDVFRRHILVRFIHQLYLAFHLPYDYRYGDGG